MSPEREKYQILMMGYLDGELSPEEEEDFLQHVKGDPELAAELTKYRNLQRITDSVRLSEPTDQEWERFWARFYNRAERQAGWLVVILGALLLIGYTAIELIRAPGVDILLKVGILAVVLGFALLFLNVLRGRLRTLRYDPYRGVRR
ncbi:MAG: zf-HC2 domain-containing protein [Planctomycetota bacterium]